jgi:hypothetical protein
MAEKEYLKNNYQNIHNNNITSNSTLSDNKKQQLY